MYYWGAYDLAGLNSLLNTIPAINSEMIDQVAFDMQSNAFIAMLQGAFTGVPYKLYAANAAAADVGLGVFLLLSVPARLMRWILVGLITYGVNRVFGQMISSRKLRVAYLSFWLLFYTAFFI